MANDGLLEGFVQAFPGDLERLLTNTFDTLLTQSDDVAADELKSAMERLLEERIHATETD